MSWPHRSQYNKYFRSSKYSFNSARSADNLTNRYQYKRQGLSTKIPAVNITETRKNYKYINPKFIKTPIKQHPRVSNPFKFVKTVVSPKKKRFSLNASRKLKDLSSYRRPATSRSVKAYQFLVKKALKSSKPKHKLICNKYSKTGICKNGALCHRSHDPSYLRLCNKFLQGCCPLGQQKCKLAHEMDPYRLPSCEFFDKLPGCKNKNCPYLHIFYEDNSNLCPEFNIGRCSRARNCPLRHAYLKTTFKKSKMSKSMNILSEDSYKFTTTPQFQLKVDSESEDDQIMKGSRMIPMYIPFKPLNDLI